MKEGTTPRSTGRRLKLCREIAALIKTGSCAIVHAGYPDGLDLQVVARAKAEQGVDIQVFKLTEFGDLVGWLFRPPKDKPIHTYAGHPNVVVTEMKYEGDVTQQASDGLEAIAFGVWYSGMRESQVVAAYERFKKETK